jgi:integrase
MATVKVLLRTSKTLKNGEHPIVIRITKDRKTKFIFTGLSCQIDLWDERTGKPKKKHPNKLELEVYIDKQRFDAQKLLLGMENEGKNYTTESFKREFKVSSSKVTVFSFCQEIIDNLIKQNKIGNSNIYKDCFRALKRFRKDQDLYFSDIDVPFLKRFEQDFFERGVAPNTVSVIMRTVRSLFNKAISERYIKKEIYPFDEYKISRLQTETIKRALKKEQIDKIINCHFVEHTKIFDAKNYFLFSFFNRGMNFSDLALLKWENITDNRLTYIRAKTGKRYSILILDPAMKILEHYKQVTGTDKSNYVFPILDRTKHITSQQISYRIHKMTKDVNKELKTIAKQSEIDFHLTTYVARHSYATIMKRKGVSTSLISEFMGHTNEKVTQIYLDSFENSVLDEVSKAIL